MSAEIHQLTKVGKDIYPTTIPKCILWGDGTLEDLLTSMTGISFPELSEKLRIVTETVNNLATINGLSLLNGGNIVVNGGSSNLPLFSVNFETGYLCVDEPEFDEDDYQYHFTVDSDGYLCVEYI